MRPMPMMPSRLPQMRWPSIHVGDHPGQCLRGSLSSAVPSASRRGTARMRAMVMSAVSSVSTPGVLVTMMPRTRAVSRSTLSTPVPKLAISFSCGPAWDNSERSILSVTVGTSTSAVLTAWTSSAWLMGLSSVLRRASNSSHMRVSTASGSFRVTMTIGFLEVGMAARALYGLAGKPATRHASARGRRLAMGFATCLTDGHLDDKTKLPSPGPPGASSPCNALDLDVQIMVLAGDVRRARYRPDRQPTPRCNRGAAAGPDRDHDRPVGAGNSGAGKRHLRVAGAPLRQPEIGPRQPAPRPGHRVSNRLGLSPRRPAGGGDQGIRELAAGARCGGHHRLGPGLDAERPTHRAHPPLGGEGGPGPAAPRPPA